MDPPSSVPNIPRSGEDLTRAFRNLPPGTLSGLDALCDHNYWLSVMKQAEIEISNEDIFRFRFAEISKTASNRLAFLAGSGEYGTFNLRYLIQQLVEQCSDMHKYTRKLEKYVVKLQRQVQDLESEQRGGRLEPQGGGSIAGPVGGGGGGGGSIAGAAGDGSGGSAGGTGSGGSRSAQTYAVPRHPGGITSHRHPPQHPHPQLHTQPLSHPQQQGPSKRPRSPPSLGSVEAAAAARGGTSSGMADEDEE